MATELVSHINSSCEMDLRERYIQLKTIELMISHYPSAAGRLVKHGEYLDSFMEGSLFMYKHRRNSSTLLVDGPNLVSYCLEFGNDTYLKGIKLLLQDRPTTIIVYVHDIITGVTSKHVTCLSWFMKFLNDIEFTMRLAERNVLECLCCIFMNFNKRMSLRYMSMLLDEFKVSGSDILSELIKCIQSELDIQLLDSIDFREVITGVTEYKKLNKTLSQFEIQEIISKSLRTKYSSDGTKNPGDIDCIVNSVRQVKKLNKSSFEYMMIKNAITKFIRISNKLYMIRDIKSKIEKKCAIETDATGRYVVDDVRDSKLEGETTVTTS